MNPETHRARLPWIAKTLTALRSVVGGWGGAGNTIFRPTRSRAVCALSRRRAVRGHRPAAERHDLHTHVARSLSSHETNKVEQSSGCRYALNSEECRVRHGRSLGPWVGDVDVPRGFAAPTARIVIAVGSVTSDNDAVMRSAAKAPGRRAHSLRSHQVPGSIYTCFPDLVSSIRQSC